MTQRPFQGQPSPLRDRQIAKEKWPKKRAKEKSPQRAVKLLGRRRFGHIAEQCPRPVAGWATGRAHDVAGSQSRKSQFFST